MRELLILAAAAAIGWAYWRQRQTMAPGDVFAPELLTYPSQPLYAIGETWRGGPAPRPVETNLGVGHVRPDGLIELPSGAILT